MKSLKPILLVLAGVLITIAMFSFKAEEPKKEYCRISYKVDFGKSIYIAYEDRTDELEISKDRSSQREAIKLMNKLSSEGWKVTSTTSYMRYNGEVGHDTDIIFLERTKP